MPHLLSYFLEAEMNTETPEINTKIDATKNINGPNMV
jgi:hypothetical protein